MCRTVVSGAVRGVILGFLGQLGTEGNWGHTTFAFHLPEGENKAHNKSSQFAGIPA